MAVTQGAVQLNCCVDHLLHHVRQKHLGDAVFLTEIFTALRLVGDVQQHESCFVDLSSTVGEHPAHALTVCQALAKGMTLNHMAGRQIQCTLRHGDIVHTMA